MPKRRSSSEDEPFDPDTLLNASGFAFQLAVEHAVTAAKMYEPWRVEGREHAWRTDTGRGYLDLVLRRGNVVLAVECKRTRNATWMFLMPREGQLSRRHARIRWIDMKPHRPNLAGWGDIQIEPMSPEAEFCAVKGGGEDQSPMLERIGAGLADAVEGLSEDLLRLDPGTQRAEIVVPVVVTNARLMLARFEPEQLNLESGEVVGATFREASHVRFRKSLGSGASPEDFEPTTLGHLGQEAERTVFVVRAANFVEWLKDFEIGGNSWPWESARSRADAQG